MQRVRLPLTDRRIDPSQLFRLRTSAGITQREVAERAQISDYWYRLIEHGTRDPSRPVAESIAKALGVSLDAITEPVVQQRDAA
jgi:transcriptional regulator with XRE-family HTH domain